MSYALKRMKMKGLPNPMSCLIGGHYYISNILHAHCSISLLFLLLFILGFSVCVQTGIGPQGPFFGSAKAEFALPLDKSPDQFLSRVQNV